MEYLPQLIEYADYLKGKKMEGMLIEAEMASPYIPDELKSIHLDGVLSKALTYMIECHFESKYNYFMPLPLKILGEFENYYCCSVGIPEQYVEGIFYWRKRPDLKVNQKVRIGAGPYKAYNTSHDTIHTNKLSFLAYGVIDEVEHLLSYISNIGKKTGYGLGDVKDWKVTKINNTPKDCIIHDSKVLRPIPELEIESESPKMYTTYYPPYWHPLNYSMCYVPIMGRW